LRGHGEVDRDWQHVNAGIVPKLASEFLEPVFTSSGNHEIASVPPRYRAGDFATKTR